MIRPTFLGVGLLENDTSSYVSTCAGPVSLCDTVVPTLVVIIHMTTRIVFEKCCKPFWYVL